MEFSRIVVMAALVWNRQMQAVSSEAHRRIGIILFRLLGCLVVGSFVDSWGVPLADSERRGRNLRILGEMLGKKMVGRNDHLVGGYYRNSFSAAGDSEGSGSSGRIDAEFTACEDSSVPARKCISLNSNKGSVFFVPSEVLPTSSMTPSERKALIHRLKLELQQIQVLQKKLESQRINTVAVSSSSDIIRSCSNGRPKNDATRKASASTSIKEKKVKSLGNKGPPFKRSSSGKIDPTKEAAVPKVADAIQMNQCETLLKRLMSHQYGWVFNKPVDVKGLNIPDYFTVIKHPMDLGTVKGKISLGAYSSPVEFAADVRLAFTNAMTYNPPGNDVHIMADTLNKYFEVRWKPIEKKLAGTDSQSLQAKSGPSKEMVTTKPLPPAKKRKITSIQYEAVPEPVKPVMTDEEKHNLGRQLESIMEDMPEHIINFLRENSSNGRECGEEEIEIDIDDFSNDTLFALRKLIDEYLQEKQKSQARDEQCELEILTESGFSNSSVQPSKVNGDEDVDICGNEPPVSSYSHVKKENAASQQAIIGISENGPSDSDLSSSSDSESDRDEASSPKHAQRETVIAEVQMGGKQSPGSSLDVNQPISGLDQLDQASPQKPSSLEPDNYQDGENAPNERQVSPGKLYRAALLSRFADTILKAREKTLSQGDKRDPEKLRREREKLEMLRNKEKARLLAEAKAAEYARRQLEAEALAEAKRKREVEREAARQALLKMEKTVEINENSRFLEDLEVLSTIPVDQLPSSADETSPDNNLLDRLGSFKFEGNNPLEQLGLFMKADDDEEEAEPPTFLNPGNDVEEGEID